MQKAKVIRRGLCQNAAWFIAHIFTIIKPEVEQESEFFEPIWLWLHKHSLMTSQSVQINFILIFIEEHICLLFYAVIILVLK